MKDRAAYRADVRARHAAMLEGVKKDIPQAASIIKARAHARWGYVDRERTSTFRSPTQAILGPNFVSPVIRSPQYPDDQTIRNDYSMHFVDTGLTTVPGAWIQNVTRETRFIEHPKLRRLLELKADLVRYTAIPPTYFPMDLRSWLTQPTPSLGVLEALQYDVIVLDPPLTSYAWDAPQDASACWSWDDIARLPIPRIASRDSFVFLWVGSGASDGLERGREVLAQWGYRRCEDIVWVQTTDQTNRVQPPSSLLAPSVQHCLMGIRGTVVRSTDSFFVHCNVDTDVLLWPGEATHAGGPISPIPKPPEMYSLIENFCLGTRRLELFGTNRNIRPGWLTIGQEVGPQAPGWDAPERLAAMPFHPASYLRYFALDPPGCPLHARANLLPHSDECEVLRPRTPPSRQDPSEAYTISYSAWHTRPVRRQPPRSQLLGQGAGGRDTVSRRSESERFSGAQAQVLQRGQQEQRFST